MPVTEGQVPDGHHATSSQSQEVRSILCKDPGQNIAQPQELNTCASSAAEPDYLPAYLSRGLESLPCLIHKVQACVPAPVSIHNKLCYVDLRALLQKRPDWPCLQSTDHLAQLPALYNSATVFLGRACQEKGRRENSIQGAYKGRLTGV